MFALRAGAGNPLGDREADATVNRPHAGTGEPLLPLRAREDPVRHRQVSRASGTQRRWRTVFAETGLCCRYQNETKRLYGVYEDHLTGKKDGEKKEWLVGGKYSLADMATEPW